MTTQLTEGQKRIVNQAFNDVDVHYGLSNAANFISKEASLHPEDEELYNEAASIRENQILEKQASDKLAVEVIAQAQNDYLAEKGLVTPVDIIPAYQKEASDWGDDWKNLYREAYLDTQNRVEGNVTKTASEAEVFVNSVRDSIFFTELTKAAHEFELYVDSQNK